MIESYYWKEELARIARTIRSVPNPSRWTERAHCVVERDLMVGFFMLRRLIELSKMTSRIRHYPMVVFACPSRLSHVDIRRAWDIYETYDMENERRMTKKPLYISNQFVHACVSFVARDKTRNWSDVYIVSDFDRSDCIWRIPIAGIRKLFLAVSRDSVSFFSMEYNAEKRDYDILTD